VHVPPEVTISASPSSIYTGQATTLAWTSSNAQHVSIDNGIGEVDYNGTLQVSPVQTTTYIITAAGPGGTVTDSVTATVSNAISINIESPQDGASINRPDILVRGTVMNACGNETYITVNGIAAAVFQRKFFANHIPLEAGVNSITVHATDTRGNNLERTITIAADTNQPYISMTLVDPIGIAPFETSLQVNSFFTPESIGFSDDGQGLVQYQSGEDISSSGVTITDPGIYYITSHAAISGHTFSDTIGVLAYDHDELDAMLRLKWEGMRSALLNNELEEAVKDISGKTRDAYGDIFSSLTLEHRLNLAAELGDIQLIKMRGPGVEYDIQTTREGSLYSFLLLFELDIDGRWKIASF